MNIICTICARGGSKGVPGKNIRPLFGKPLIAYTIEQALESGVVDKVYVSTDCEDIANAARKAGAIIPFMRPAHLAQDGTPKMDTINHAVDTIEAMTSPIDIAIDLDATSPLRTPQDIINALKLIGPDCDAVITGFKSTKTPYFNMVELTSDGHAGLSKKPDSPVYARQSSPPVFAMNGSIYIWKREVLKKGIWDNNPKFYEMPHERSVDVDTEIDWKLVEILMSQRLGKTL